MSKELAPIITQQELLSVQNAAKMFLDSGLFSDTKTTAQGVVKILAGREQGMGPFESMRDINIIQGKTCLAAAQIGARIKQSGGNWEVVQFDEEACILRFSEGGKVCKPDISFSMADAVKLGLAGKDNYKKQARTMLFWRALTMGARMIFPHVFGGAIYTPDEMGAAIDVTPEPVEGPKPKKEKVTRPTKSSKVEFSEAQPVEKDSFAPSGDFVPLDRDNIPGEYTGDGAEPLTDDLGFPDYEPSESSDPWDHRLEADIKSSSGIDFQGKTYREIGEGRLQRIKDTKAVADRLTETDATKLIECLALVRTYGGDQSMGEANRKPQGFVDGDTPMPFGKFKGKPMSEINSNYKDWLRIQDLEKYPEVKAYLMQEGDSDE